MSEKKLNKTLSILIALTLVLGLIGPVAETIGDSDILESSSTLLEENEGDLIVEEGETYKITSDELRDGNVIVNGTDAHLKILNSTLTLRQDRYNLYNITVENGGKLSLYNGTISTWREDADIIRPFLKTDVTVTNESKLSLSNNSAFSFPGFVYILDGSELKMRDSEFKALDSIPDYDFDNYDYLWAEGDREELAEDDNNDGPRLIVMDDSKIYMENSRIDDYYNLDEDDRKEMTWYPLGDDGSPIEELQDNDDYLMLGGEEELDTIEITEWFLSNPMVPHEYLDEYPYINPVNIISSLFVEIDYELVGEENYTGDGQLNYSTPGGQEGNISLGPDPDEPVGTSIWELELSEFFKGERDEETRLLLGDDDFKIEVWNPEDGEDEEIRIEELRLVSSYDNDIHVIDSDFTIIDSFLDLDVNPSNIDPREEESSPTCEETYLQNSNMDHKTVRFYGDSSFRSYGLSIADDEVDGDADPWILNTESAHNQTWIYRWVELQVTTEDGTPLPGAELDPIPNDFDDDVLWEMVNETLNDPTDPRNSDAWQYLNETGYGEYDEDEEVYIAGEEGKVTMFLVSDRVNYPDDWPNSEFVGNYFVNTTYIDEDQEIDVRRDVSIDHLEDLMTMENPEELNVQLPVKLPNLQAEELIVEEDSILPGDEVELNMTVANVGDGDAYDVNVSFYEGEFDWDNPDENYFNSTNITLLESGESEYVNVTWEAGDPGSYDLIGVVDPQNNITEKNTDNNIIEITVDVLEKANFIVEVDEIASDNEVVEGENLSVVAEITNEGEEEATQTIELYDTVDVDNEVLDSYDITLGDGEEDTITLTWETEVGESGNYDLNVSSDDDEDQINVDVLEQAEFMVEIDTDASDQDVVEGDPLDVVVNITNTGEEEATQTIRLYDSEDQETTLDSSEITLGDGEEDTITLTWETEVDESGNYDLNVSSDDDEDQINVDVLEQAEFTVEIDVEASDEKVVEGEDLNVVVNITNMGEEESTQTIELYDVDEDEIILDHQDVTLGRNESETISLTWETEVNEAGDYFLEVKSENDESALGVSVLQKAFFEVTIDETPSDEEAVEGEELEIYVDIVNTGEQEEEVEKIIELYDVDAPNVILDSQEVSLGPGDDQLITLTWETDVNDAGDYTLQVASEDDEDDLDVTLLRVAEFTVEIDSEESDMEGVEGQNFNIVADIENIGEEDRVVTQTIELQDEDGTLLDHENVTLGPGQEERVNLTWETELGDAGDETQTFRLEVVSEDDDDRIFIDLHPAPNLNFVTETWYVDGEEIDTEDQFELEEGDTLTFEGQIRNDGGVPIYNALVEHLFPDGRGDSQHIDVEVDETVNVSAEWNVRVIDNPEMSIWINSTAEDERTHDEIRYYGEDFEDIEPTEIRFENLEFPEQEMVPGDSYHFGGRVVRDADDKPLADIDVTISIQSSPALISETVSTDENGEFGVFLRIPDGAAGEYAVVFEAQTYNIQSTQESVEVETDVLEVAGIPWWLLLVIVAIAAGGAGSAFAYFKFFGTGEMVECGNCGSTISADATSCPKCGVEFDMDTVKCSECGEWIPADQDVCPECGVEFVKTGKEVEDYTERMRKQYKKFLRKKKREAEEELGKDLSQKEFIDWWKDKPSFVKFDEWLERKEKQRREGSIECPECGTLNSVDDAVCQKCGTSLIDLGEPEDEEESTEMFLEKETPEEELEEEKTFEEELEGEEEISEHQEDEDTLESEEGAEEQEESTESEDEKKKVKKKPKKKVKKKVVKKSNDEKN